jgi:hypothetical protein
VWFFISNQKLKPEYRIEGGQAGKARRQRNHIVLALPATTAAASVIRASQIAFDLQLGLVFQNFTIFLAIQLCKFHTIIVLLVKVQELEMKL